MYRLVEADPEVVEMDGGQLSCVYGQSNMFSDNKDLVFCSSGPLCRMVLRLPSACVSQVEVRAPDEFSYTNPVNHVAISTAMDAYKLQKIAPVFEGAFDDFIVVTFEAPLAANYLILEMCCNDDDRENVDIERVKITAPKIGNHSVYQMC